MRMSGGGIGRALVCAGAAVIGAACGSAPAPARSLAANPFRPVADVKQLMEAVVDPAADVVWESVATIITKDGVEERAPRTKGEWANLRTHAMMLAESGNLLMMPGRARDGDQWMTLARALVDKSEIALRAAETRNIETLYDIGGQIDTVCENCHKKYWPDY
jgi:hypothetical protein